MNVKRILKVMIVMLVICLATVSPCYAARIYNNTGTTVVVGSSGTSVSIAPGQRSESLSWNVNNVSVRRQDNNGEICSLDFGLKNQIKGGNYMVIEQSGNCFICDSNRKPIEGNGSC